ncbi:MAG: class I SAM-dependent methyltransferase [Planctomycetota bacterium]|nr:MAG: class I SAM-dependent methyltransferase [Planctomycetota bacterium]
MPSDAQAEIDAGQRFAFGANWTAFLSLMSPERLNVAEAAIRQLLGTETLAEKTFLDIGSGSGLSSLAAHSMGARVTSFDFDQQSVNCTTELRRRYALDDPTWTVQQGSVLDSAFMGSLGTFDVVYSWGVLHHTGQMWNAIDQATLRVAPGGQLFIAIYNDEGGMSRFWTAVKRIYCSGPLGRWLMLGVFIPYFVARHLAKLVLTGGQASRTSRTRGMSVYYDWIDWLGGYPFEVAKVEELLHFCQKRGFVLENLTTTNRLGCNELVFRRKV